MIERQPDFGDAAGRRPQMQGAEMAGRNIDFLLAERIERWRMRRRIAGGEPAMPEGAGALVDFSVQPERQLAHTIGLAWLVSVALLMVAGISNPRYAMPAAVLLPPLVVV